MVNVRVILKVILYLLVVGVVQAQKTYYLSPYGNDNHSGLSPQQAWKTLAKASQITYMAGDSLLLECNGVYHGTLALKGSGNEWAPVVIGSYGSGNKPLITGAEALTGSWTEETMANTKTWHIPFADKAWFVYVEGQPYYLARYPDNQFFYIDNVSVLGNFLWCGKWYPYDSVFSSAALQTIPMTDLNQAYVSIRTSGWTIATFRVVGFNKSTGTLALHAPSYGWNPSLNLHTSFSEKYGFFLSNKKEFLSVAGEFWVDTVQHRLYLVKETMPVNVTYSRHKYGIHIVDTFAHDIKMVGLAIGYQTVSAIEVKENDHRIEVTQCHLHHVPFGLHHRGRQHATDCLIRLYETKQFTLSNNLFSDIYRSAIACLPAQSIIVNNTIHRNALLPNMAEWLNLPRSFDVIDFDNGSAMRIGAGSYVAYNIIDSAGHYGIFAGQACTVERNVISNTCLNYYDCGACYVAYQDSVIVRNNFISSAGGNSDLGIWLTATNAPAVIHGNGVYLDFNMDLRFTAAEVSGNTITRCGRGVSFLTTDDAIGMPNKYGAGFCSPPAHITGNTLYDNSLLAFSVGALSLPDVNKLPSVYLYEPMVFSNNVAVQFEPSGFLVGTSNHVGKDVQWGQYAHNYYVSVNSPYSMFKYYKSGLITKTEWLNGAEWQQGGQEQASRFIVPMQSHIQVVDTMPQGNLIRNSHFHSNLNYWGFASTNWNCTNNKGVDSTSYFPSHHLRYYNPTGLCAINNSVTITTHLADSSNAFAAEVHLDPETFYELSFDMYSSLAVDAANSASTFWTVSLVNTQNGSVLFSVTVQPRTTVQRLRFLFKPNAAATQAYLKWYSYHLQGNYTLRLDNVTLFPVLVTEWQPSYKFPLLTNPSDETITYTVPNNWFLDLDSAVVGPTLALDPWSSKVLIRLDSCALISGAPAPEIPNGLQRSMIQVFPNPAAGNGVVVVDPHLVGQELLVSDLQGKLFLRMFIPAPRFYLSLPQSASGVVLVRAGSAVAKWVIH